MSTTVFPTESMRGPGLKSTLDVRRVWRCPTCGYERRVGQATTSVLCFCNDPPVQMKLIEGKRPVRPEPRPVARFVEESDLPEDEPNSAPRQRPAAPTERAATSAEPAPPIAEVRVAAVEIVVETVIEAVVVTPLPDTPPDAPASSSKKRRRRNRGRRGQEAPAQEGAGDEVNPTDSPPSTTPSEDPPATPKEEFGTGIDV